MLDHVGTVALIAAIVVNLGAVAGALPGGVTRRISLLAVGGLWTGLAIALAGSGWLRGNSGLGPVPPIGILVVVPLLTAGGAAMVSPAFRKTLLGLPTNLLIGLNTMRVGGVFFLLLAAQHRLVGPFPYSAGLGDMITGALALPVIFMARTHASQWNWFGALDLFAAVTLGVMTAPGALQVFHLGLEGPLPVQSLPWSLIPTVLVPFYLILHGVVYAQLRGRVAVWPASYWAGVA